MVVGIVLFLSLLRLNAARDEAYRIEMLLRENALLQSATAEFLTHHEERVRLEWVSRYGAVSKLLDGLQGDDKEQATLIKGIRENHKNSGAAFDLMLASASKIRGKDTVASTEMWSVPAMREMEAVLGGQIRLRSQDVVSDLLRMSAKARNDMANEQDRMALVAVLSILLLVAVITAAFLTIMKSLVKPIAALRRGTEIVGAGDLDFRIGTDREDEIGALSRSFDAMAGKLKSITVSRDALEDEIAERKRAEEELKESEGKFRVIFEGSKDGIILADVESKKFYTGNKTFCDMLQYTLDEIRQLCVADIHPEEDLPRVLDAFERGVKQESELAGDLPVRRKDGSVWWAEVTASLVTISGKKYLLGNFRDITERKRSEEASTRLSMAVDQAAEGIVITDPEGRIEYINPSFERITGYLQKEAVGRNMRILKSGKQDEMFYRNMWETIFRGEVWRGNFINKKKDGTLYEEESIISPVRTASGKIINFVAGKRDITQDIILQKQLQAAQKMESVGTLAGGIAHDFNNVLTVIIGYGEMLKLRIANDPRAISDLDEVLQSAERAAMLTRQLLTFARRQVVEPVNLDLNEVMTGLVKLLRKITREDIEIKNFPAECSVMIRADVGQVEQVVMNLCFNARDAMPEGGQLVIDTRVTLLEEGYLKQYPYMKAGRYAVLSVSDTGVGMDEKTQERIFEPFFTTKGPDKGTGLGLAVVYGIVKQHNGFIHLYSEPGKGTTFRIYFPEVDAPADAKVIASQGVARGGSETILLAEDNESVRHLAEQTLISYGYRVLVACDGEETVDIFRRHQKEIAMAVLDVVMPKKGGKQAYDEMITTIPGLKVLFMSGYSANAIHDSFVLLPGVPFLQKPFNPGALARKVREALDGELY